MTHGKHVELYRDKARKWRWRTVKNARTISDSGQGYADKRGVIRGLEIDKGGHYIPGDDPTAGGTLTQWASLPQTPTVPYQIDVPVHVLPEENHQ